MAKKANIGAGKANIEGEKANIEEAFRVKQQSTARPFEQFYGKPFEKITALETEQYLSMRAEKGSREKLGAILDLVPDSESTEGDAFPGPLGDEDFTEEVRLNEEETEALLEFLNEDSKSDYKVTAPEPKNASGKTIAKMVQRVLPSTALQFEEFYDKRFEEITPEDIGEAEEIDWGDDVGGEVY